MENNTERNVFSKIKNHLRPSEWIGKHSLKLLIISLVLMLLIFGAPLFFDTISSTAYITSYWIFGLWISKGTLTFKGYLNLFQGSTFSVPLEPILIMTSIGLILLIVGSSLNLKKVKDSLKPLGAFLLSLGGLIGFVGITLSLGFINSVLSSLGHPEFSYLMYTISPSVYIGASVFLYYFVIGLIGLLDPIFIEEKSFNDLKQRKIWKWILICLFVPIIGSLIYSYITLRDLEKFNRLAYGEDYERPFVLNPSFNFFGILLGAIMLGIIYWPLIFTVTLPGMRLKKNFALDAYINPLSDKTEFKKPLPQIFFILPIALISIIMIYFFVTTLFAMSDYFIAQPPGTLILFSEFIDLIFKTATPLALGLLIGGSVLYMLPFIIANVFWQRRYNHFIQYVQENQVNFVLDHS